MYGNFNIETAKRKEKLKLKEIQYTVYVFLYFFPNQLFFINKNMKNTFGCCTEDTHSNCHGYKKYAFPLDRATGSRNVLFSIFSLFLQNAFKDFVSKQFTVFENWIFVFVGKANKTRKAFTYLFGKILNLALKTTQFDSPISLVNSLVMDWHFLRFNPWIVRILQCKMQWGGCSYSFE